VLVMREDGCVMSQRPTHDAEVSMSRVAPLASDVIVAQPERELHHSGAPRALLDEAQAEQALWQEFRDHDTSINNALTEALHIHKGASIRLFEVGVLRSTRGLFLVFSRLTVLCLTLPPCVVHRHRVPDRCLQELQGWARARYNHLT
jgi:hypothetical protein